MKIQLLAGTLLLLSSFTSQAQEAENSVLYQKIIWLDSQVFELGFNQCQLPIFDKYIATDLEFLHDKSGTQNKQQFMTAVQNNICSNPDGKPIRTLTNGSTQVFPLKNNGVLYGAIQQGQHRFHTKGADVSKTGYTNAKFTHVWLLRNGLWQLKNSLSYDHQNVFNKKSSKNTNKSSNSLPINLFKITIASFTFSLQFRK